LSNFLNKESGYLKFSVCFIYAGCFLALLATDGRSHFKGSLAVCFLSA